VQKDLIDKLKKKNQQCDKPIMGTAWYNILDNFYYAADFAYVPPSIPDRHKLIYREEIDQQHTDNI